MKRTRKPQWIDLANAMGVQVIVGMKKFRVYHDDGTFHDGGQRYVELYRYNREGKHGKYSHEIRLTNPSVKTTGSALVEIVEKTS